LDATKAYDFTIRFGEETDTLDAEGELVGTSDARPGPDEVQALLPHFTGEIEQVPPIYSALKIEGKAAYARARAGEKIQLKSRRVEIFDLLLIDMTSDSATFSATVSKGTYIRSLARDIAHALGTLGHVSYLRRTSAGPFSLASAISLDILEEAAKARALTRTVLPLEAALDDIPALPVTTRQAEMLRKGQRLAGFPAKPGLGLATLEGTPVALVEALADGLRVVRGFNL
ncbi:MAG: tRNA pseudouridine(55) synthase TruB, partial [Sphingomicrobium sp.]